ncbi:MAG: type II toxin-antitoxin system ParD family antitoxin [Planctomycetota bacterium]
MPRTVNLDLPDDLERYVADHAGGDEGRYIEFLLRERMETERLRESLRAGVEAGLNDLAAGRFVALDTERAKAELEAVRAEGRRRRGTQA